MTPKLSIGIPIYNNLAYTQQILKNLYDSTKSEFELIIVDDASTDGSFEWILDNYIHKGIKLIQHPTNLGVTAGWETIVTASTGDYIAIFNNDILVCPDWDVPLIAALDNDTDLWMVSPYTTKGELPADFPAGGGRLHNGFPMCGWCFMVKRSAYEAIRYDDENYFPPQLKLWYQDNWLVQAITRKFNKKADLIKESYVHHFTSKTIGNVPNLVEITNNDAIEFGKLNFDPNHKGYL